MAVYYVTKSGEDRADGSASSPWRTINHAAQSNLRAGDEVVVRAGVYNESVNITRGGSATGDVTLRSETPGKAVINPPASACNAISINANYVTIDGFEIRNAQGDGIEGNGVHYITLLNNISHNNSDSGIHFHFSELRVIDDNITHSNAASAWYSGVSVFENRNLTGDQTTEGFRAIIRNNISNASGSTPTLGTLVSALR